MNRIGQRVSLIALLAGLVATAFSISLADTARAAGTCTEEWKPVCASANNWQQTYSNACWAKMRNAKILYSGQCKWGQGK